MACRTWWDRQRRGEVGLGYRRNPPPSPSQAPRATIRTPIGFALRWRATSWKERSQPVVARLPVGWFTGENLPMLRELARHIDFANWLAADIEQARASPTCSRFCARMVTRPNGSAI
jgi:hypothetical protein